MTLMLSHQSQENPSFSSVIIVCFVSGNDGQVLFPNGGKRDKIILLLCQWIRSTALTLMKNLLNTDLLTMFSHSPKLLSIYYIRLHSMFQIQWRAKIISQDKLSIIIG